MQLKVTDTYTCGCGRSPTGQCIGWHGLTEEDYQKKLEEYESNKDKRGDENGLGINH